MTAGDGTDTGPPSGVGPGFDPAEPSLARVNDYALGGKDNYQVDRELHDQIVAISPDFGTYIRANRRFTLQALTRMAESGLDQFVVLGAGLPVAPNIHEIVRDIRPGARVVYVEPEPMAAAHARALLARERGVVAVQHEVDDPVSIITDPRVAATVDPARPLGVHFGLMQVVPQPAAVQVMAFHRDKLAPGSVLALSALVEDPRRPASPPVSGPVEGPGRPPWGDGPPPWGAGPPPWGDGPPPWAAGPPPWGAGPPPWAAGPPPGDVGGGPPSRDARGGLPPGELPLAVRLASQLVFRTPREVAELFAGLDVLEPGLRDLADWARLTAPIGAAPIGELPERLGGLAGLARVT